MWAAEGAKIVGVDYNGAAGQAVIDGITAKGAEAIFVQANLRKKEDVLKIKEAALEKFGTVTTLANCAGVLVHKPFLAGVLFGIITGNLGDKFGIKKMMTVGIIVFALGAFWRAFSHDFVMLMISSLCMGFGVAVLNANSTKGIRLWFPGPSMGPAMGLYVTGASIGAGIAISIGPTFATYSDAFMLCGWLAIAALVVWLVMYRTHPTEKATQGDEAVGMAAFTSVMKSKNVWIVSFMIFFIFGCSTTVQTYMSAGFAETSGGQMAAVGSLALLSSVAVALGFHLHAHAHYPLSVFPSHHDRVLHHHCGLYRIEHAAALRPGYLCDDLHLRSGYGRRAGYG